MIRTLIAATYAATVQTLNDRKGVTAAEYAVLATGIVLVVGIAAGALGTRLSDIFGTLGKPLAG
ncbi:pilus assembly protein Flp/PilA [Humitalea rosea]|uniref:Pilus assembly protein Flp/PilA n=1 Tax=Humitalea rosea TaxID=990373 RepID=A0A2W7J967_9PROT|nr:Flp family type IVb pilin [Humitalea rosea]PZW48406.1 pilus assembly protein Flp/PilA [Humitalea rosea]